MSHEYCELQAFTKKATDIYDVPTSRANGPVKAAALKFLGKKSVAKLLFIATALNFVLLITMVAIFAYFQTRNQESLKVLNSDFSQGSGVGTGAVGPIGPPGPPGEPGAAANGGGAIYIRWGESACPSTSGTQLLYSGTTGGSNYNTGGSGANHLCLPNTPEYSAAIVSGNISRHASIWGTQYESPVVAGAHARNVPCAVCYVSTRPTVVMIPAKASCPPTWTREYYGYLMAEEEDSGRHRTMYECVDASQESGTSNPWGALLYHVEAQCGAGDGGLSCPPYIGNQELHCVVCTK